MSIGILPRVDRMRNPRIPKSGEALIDETDMCRLVRDTCEGSESSFSRLHDLTKARVLEIAMNITHDRHQSEDVLQDVYLKAWTRCAQFDPIKGTVLFWLSGISRHSALDSLRRHRRRPLGIGTLRPEDEDDDPYADFASPEPGPLETLRYARLLEALRLGVAGLPAPQRHAVTMACLEERSHPEIAQQLGRPLGTVKSWIRRSTTALQPLLLPHR